MTTDKTTPMCRDPVGCFLVAYEEYLDGKRDYRDLPPAFGMCPEKLPSHDASAMTTNERTNDSMKFRKKPVVIDAVQLTQDTVNAHVLDRTPLPDGCYVSSSEAHKDRREVHRAVVRLKNHTRDLVMPGDWIVRDAVGALSVCKPDVFAATYEAATSPSPVTDGGLPCEFGGEERAPMSEVDAGAHGGRYIER